MPTLLEAFEQHLRLERRRGALTTARYRAIVDDFARHLVSDPETSSLRLTDLTRLHCIGFLRSPTRKAMQEPSRSVWNQRLSALRSFFRWFLEQELIVKDPTHGIERHKIAASEPIPLSLGELFDLVDAAERSSPAFRSRNTAIVLVLFNTALRVRELVSLNIEQIEWDAGLFRDVRTKGDKRLCAKFPPVVAAALQRHLAERVGRHPTSSGAIFLSMRGTRFSVRAVEELVRELGRKAGISRPVTPHLLRHSCATILSEGGTMIKVIQGICGHAFQATTERYIHARAGADRVAIDTLGELVANGLAARRQERALAA